MKTAWLRAAMWAAAIGLAGAAGAQEVRTEIISDSFSGIVRDPLIWRNSAYITSTARLRVRDGSVAFFRSINNMDGFQQASWDARFSRTYDNGDYLQVGATVRIPHKVRTGSGAYSYGIGLASAGAQFVELMVEDSADGRAFVIYVEDTSTAFQDIFVFDAPQNVTVFDILVSYSADRDTLAFYWSIPGLARVFRIGRIEDFATLVGGTTPRRIHPYIIGTMFEGAAVPLSWRVTLDDFYAYREDAP